MNNINQVVDLTVSDSSDEEDWHSAESNECEVVPLSDHVEDSQLSEDQSDVPHDCDAAVVFKYKPRVISAKFIDNSTVKLNPHPADAVVSSAFYGTPSPNYASVRLAVQLKHAFKTGNLSSLQYEGIARSEMAFRGKSAMQKSKRRGFILGDQTGMGKGRQIAGCIVHNWFVHGQTRALWVSVNSGLFEDAKRDFHGILDPKWESIPLYAYGEDKRIKRNKPISHSVRRGVLFVTYTKLSLNWRGETKRLTDWLRGTPGDTSEGIVVFDECHLAKNLLPPGTKYTTCMFFFNFFFNFEFINFVPNKFYNFFFFTIHVSGGTNRGRAVLLIQTLLPYACVLYSSATSLSSIRSIAAFDRLGLWDVFVFQFQIYFFFIRNFNTKDTTQHPGEVAMCEMVGRDLFARGLYMYGVDFSITDVKLSENFQKTYDIAVGVMWRVMDKVKMLKSIFVNANRNRFYKAIIINGKLIQAVKDAKELVSKDFAVVFSLFSTGESEDTDCIDIDDDVIIIDDDETCNIENRKPSNEIQQNLSREQIETYKKSKNSMWIEIENIRSELLLMIENSGIDNCNFVNPIDYIKRELGNDNVAELTGRKKHWVEDVCFIFFKQKNRFFF
eukprot:GSMAST32.ASY1.ANO1.2137.1 assembled CDS